jgi:hypothetical protein
MGVAQAFDPILCGQSHRPLPGETSCLTMAHDGLVIAGGKRLGLTLADRHIIAERAVPAVDQQVA